MAVIVGYFENTDECYTEGPFVMVSAGGWRLECGKPGTQCPTLPPAHVYEFCNAHGRSMRLTLPAPFHSRNMSPEERAMAIRRYNADVAVGKTVECVSWEDHDAEVARLRSAIERTRALFDNHLTYALRNHEAQPDSEFWKGNKAAWRIAMSFLPEALAAKEDERG